MFIKNFLTFYPLPDGRGSDFVLKALKSARPSRNGNVGIILALLFFLPTVGQAWNALGHRIIAQIAYDQLTPRTKRILNHYNHSIDKGYRSQGLVNAAVWLDYLRTQRNDPYRTMHYINLCFSEDGTPLPEASSVNAVSAIENSAITLKQSDVSDYKKGLALRILLHVVGDIHQPMHATCQASHLYPDGDRGGHGIVFSRNSVAKNLHSYWDNGAGYLMYKNKSKKMPSIKKIAHQLELEYPCSSFSLKLDPNQWAMESHEIGVSAYRVLYQQNPDYRYQLRTIKIVKKRIAMAGCRLGAVLNQNINVQK